MLEIGFFFLFWLNPVHHRTSLSFIACRGPVVQSSSISLAVRVAQCSRGSTAHTPAGNLSVSPCPLSYSGWVIHHYTLFGFPSFCCDKTWLPLSGYSPSLREVRAIKHGGMPFVGLCLAPFLYCLGWTAQEWWAGPPIKSQDCPQDMPTGQSDVDSYSIETFLSNDSRLSFNCQADS